MKHTFELSFLIGLSAMSDSPSPLGIADRWRAWRRSRMAHRTLCRYYSSFTSFRTRGTWRGNEEHSMVVLVIIEGTPLDIARTAETVARRIGRNLRQDAVAFTLCSTQCKEVKVRRAR